MNESSETAAIEHIAASSGTRNPRDLATQSALIRAARSPEQRAFTIRTILNARAQWLAWLTVTQRKWQCETTRRPSRARHHDSIAIRERYVRVSS